MAFMAKILSWRFRHLNIVGCLLKRRPTKGGSRAPQAPPPPPSYAPGVLTQKQRRMMLQNLGQFDGGEMCSFEQRPLSEHGCIFEET